MQRFDCLAKDAPILGLHFLEASAGTGKTFAIEQVVARLIQTQECELEQILVVTFTRAAARELKLRIRSNLSRLAQRNEERPLVDALAIFDRSQIFTIHSFCSRMLNEFGFATGLSPMSITADSSNRDAGIRDFLERGISPELLCLEQLEIVLKWAGSMEELAHLLKTKDGSPEDHTFSSRAQEFFSLCPPLVPSKLQEDWNALKGNYKKEKGDLEGQIEALATGNFAKLIREKGTIFSFLCAENKKIKAKDPEHLNYPGFFEWGKRHLLPLIEQAADPRIILDTLLSAWKPIDRAILLESGELTHDELLLAMRRAIDTPLFCEKIRQKYTAVLIDEFQDTDPIQWEIFEKLFLSKDALPKAVYLIGDPKQSIYRFRKADLYTYLKAKQAIPTEGHFYLDTNFRSSQSLISTLNQLFDREWLHLPREKTTLPYIPVRAGTDLKTEFLDGKGAVHCVFLGKQDIYAYIAGEILRLKGEVAHYRDWAVLVKDRFEAAQMQTVLTSLGIPSHCASKEPLADTLAFEAIREFLEALANPTNLAVIKRVLAGPFYHFSAADIQALDHFSLEVYRFSLEERGLSATFRVFFQDRPFLNRQFSSDCRQILERLFEWEQQNGFTFEGVFQFFDKMGRDTDLFQRKEEGEDDVQILTMHMSKGLEYSIVFALGLASRTPACDEEAQSEKLRQLYVAATRAKKRLYIPIPIHSKEPLEGTEAPMELFCKALSSGEALEQALEKIALSTSLSIEKVAGPVPLPQSVEKISPQSQPRQRIEVPLQPSSYMLSFTALAQETEREFLDPLPEGELPRGPETGVLIHRIYERIFSENEAWKHRSPVSRIVQEEMGLGPLAFWVSEVDEMVQASLDLLLPHGFCLRDLEATSIRAEVEFLFDSAPHYLKGFIDLVFLRNEQLYFVDWKTNWLASYDETAVIEAISTHQYDLQASIYAEALKKSGLELPVSAIYLFVRGPAAYCFKPKTLGIHDPI